MTFFARPVLDNEQFKQLSGSTLTLSGQTQIAGVDGFSISDGTTYIPIIVTGGTSLDVLTLYNNQIVLKPASGTGGGVYSGASPTTCTVGGLVASTAIYGQSISNILEQILVPTLNPVIVEPSSFFSISPSTTTYETGCQVAITGSISFSPGSITPAYCGGPSVRSSGATCYSYTYKGTPYSGVSSSCIFPTLTASTGSNSMSGCVLYASGGTPLNSSGSAYGTALSAGTTNANTVTINGILPWYWGLSTSGIVDATCVANCGCGIFGCKCVGNVGASCIPITYNSSSGDYIWFALPSCAATKTCWYVNGTNNGCIGGVGNLFATYCTLPIISAENCWSGCNYEIYVSCNPTGTASGVPMYIY